MFSKSSDNSWRVSASKSAFTVALPLTSDEDGSACTVSRPHVKERNMHACGRCASIRKKCNMLPPYSSAKCEECTRAGVALCPPHKPRRNGRKTIQLHSGNATLSIPVENVDDTPFASSSKSASHPFSLAMNNLCEPTRASTNGGQLVDPSKLGLFHSSNMIDNRAPFYTEVDNGALDLFLAEDGLSLGEDWAELLLGAQESSDEFNCWACRIGFPHDHGAEQPSSSAMQTSLIT